jgi:hypothetical protein
LLLALRQAESHVALTDQIVVVHCRSLNSITRLTRYLAEKIRPL